MQINPLYRMNHLLDDLSHPSHDPSYSSFMTFAVDTPACPSPPSTAPACPMPVQGTQRHPIIGWWVKWCLVLLSVLNLPAAFAAPATAAIRIEGLSGQLLDNARAHVSAISLSCDAPNWQASLALGQATRAVRRALNALGHYSPQIKPSLEHPGSCWHLLIEVDAGPPIKVTELTLGLTGPGQNNALLRSLLKHSGLHQGMTLDQGLYSTLKAQLDNAARTQGYFDAHFTRHDIRVDPTQHSATINLVLDTGERYAFGPTQITVHSVNPDLIRGFLAYHQGQPYDNAAVIESQNALVASGYFDTVRLVTNIHGRQHGVVPMQLVTSPARRYQLLMGAGYSTDTGPALKFDFRNRRANRAGHRYELNLQLSRIQSQVTARYEIPLANPRTDWLTLEGGYQYQNTLTAQSRIWKLGASRTHLLASDWLRRLSLTYLNENSSIAGQTLSGHFLMPGIALSKTVAIPAIYPQRGWMVAAGLSGAARGISSTVSFAQAKLQLSNITPLLGGSVLTRANIGATAINDISQLPATLRFFAGGARSIRGYAYESLGPTNSEGVVIGGRYLIIGSLEYDHHLSGNFYWAVFYDAGNAFDNWPFLVHRGAGIGLRWHSPLGPIRFDIGRALNPPPGAGLYTIQISMGPAL